MWDWLVLPLHGRKPLSTSPSWASHESVNKCPGLKPNCLSFGCQPGTAPRWVALRGEQSPPWLPFWLVAPWTEMTADICKTQERSLCLRLPCAVTLSLIAVHPSHFPHWGNERCTKSAMHIKQSRGNEIQKQEIQEAAKREKFPSAASLETSRQQWCWELETWKLHLSNKDLAIHWGQEPLVFILFS